MKPRTKRLFKIYAGYTFSFLIPCLLVCSVLYIYAAGSLRAEVERWNHEKLTQLRNSTDSQMQELSALASKLSLDPRLTPFMLANNYHRLESISELHRYKSGNSLIEEVMLYVRGEKYVFTSTGITEYQRVVDRLYSRIPNDIEHVLHETNQKTILPAVPMDLYTGQQLNIITYAYPLPYPTPYPYGVVLILVKQSELLAMIDPILGSFDGGAAILDEKGRVLAATVKGGELSVETLVTMSGSAFEGPVGQVDSNRTTYSVSRTKSDETGWTFVAAMPASQFYQKVSYMQALIALAISIPLLGGLLFIVYILMMKYKPIVHLTHEIRSRWSDLEWKDKGNEVDFLHRSFHEAFEKNKHLRETLDSQKHVLREKVYSDLIRGKYVAEAELQADLARHEFAMPGSRFFLSVLRFEPNGLSKEDLPALPMPYTFHRTHSGRWDAVVLELWPEEVICCLFSYTGDPGEEQTEDHRRAVLHKFWKSFPVDLKGVRFFTGGCCNEWTKINRSYIEAMAAREYQSFYPSERFLFFEEVAAGADTVEWFSYEKLLRFTHAVKQGDETVAVDTLDEMFQSLYEQQSMLMMKFVLSDITNHFVKAIGKDIVRERLSEIGEWSRIVDLAELQRRMAVVVKDVCAEVDSRREADQSELAKSLLDEVHRNVLSYDLSLDSLADANGMSPSSLSKYFKKLTGSSFSDYIFELRLEYVKRELVHTARPVKDIVKEAGYIAVSSFIDRFKKKEGVTPGEYRQLYRATEGDAS